MTGTGNNSLGQASSEGDATTDGDDAAAEGIPAEDSADGMLTSSGSPSTAGETGAGETSESSGSTTDPPAPTCGDAVPNNNEACDDGDDVDANGCTNQCQISGSIRWVLPFDGSPNQSELLRSVVYHPGQDSYFAVGHIHGEASESFRVEVDPEGATLQEVVVPEAGDQDDTAVAVGPGGELAILTTLSDVIRVQQVASATLAVQDAPTFSGTGGGETLGWDLVYGPEGFPLAVGSIPDNGTDGWLARIQSGWMTAQTIIVDEPNIEQFRAVTWATGPSAYFATYNVDGAPGHIRRYDATLSLQDDITVSDPSNIQLRGITANDDALFAVGLATAGSTIAHAYAFEWDGTERWHTSWSGDAAVGAYFIEVATDAEGNVVVVGSQYEPDPANAGQTLVRPVVRKLEPSAGAALWTTVVDVPRRPEGSLVGVTVGPDNRIIAVGGTGAAGQGINPVVVALEP